MALRILAHSYYMIVRNISQAIRIAFMPWLIVLVLHLINNLLRFGDIIPQGVELSNVKNTALGPLLTSLIFIATTCAYLWSIVGWHRFILLGETAEGYFPNWHSRYNFNYFLKGIILVSIIIFPLIVMMIMTSVLGVIAISGGLFVVFLWGFVAMFMCLRFGLILPATAIGVSMNISASWVATRGLNSEICGMAFICTILVLIPDILEWAFRDNVMQALAIPFINGLIGVFFAGVLTTLYGVLIEKREL